jgi:replicative DNA helicase
MRARAEGRHKPIPLPHLPRVQKALNGGLWPGCWVLVGNTGSGKSQFALQLSWEAAKRGAPVLYVGLELGKVDLTARMLGLASEKNWSRLYRGENSHSEKSTSELEEVASDYGPQLAALPWHLELAPPFGWSHEQLAAGVAGLCARYPAGERGGLPPLVVVDFLQLVTSPVGQPQDSLRERIGRMAYAARAAAREHGAVVLLVSSTARANYATLNGQKAKDDKDTTPIVRRPAYLFVGLGKESGEVEYAADGVLALVKGDAGEPTDAELAQKVSRLSKMHLAVAKQRAGQAQWVHGLQFNGGWFSEDSAQRGKAF